MQHRPRLTYNKSLYSRFINIKLIGIIIFIVSISIKKKEEILKKRRAIERMHAALQQKGNEFFFFYWCSINLLTRLSFFAWCLNLRRKGMSSSHTQSTKPKHFGVNNNSNNNTMCGRTRPWLVCAPRVFARQKIKNKLKFAIYK